MWHFCNKVFEFDVHHRWGVNGNYLFLNGDKLVSIDARYFDILCLDIIMEFVLVHEVNAIDVVIELVDHIDVGLKCFAFDL